MHPADDTLEVEHDVSYVLLDALDGRELVCDALDADARDGGAGERGEQYASQRVAERVAEPTIERLDREGATVLLHGLACDPGDLEVEHESPNVVLVSHRRHAGAGSEAPPPGWATARAKVLLLRVQLDDELLLHRRSDLAPLRLAQHLGRQRLVIGLQPRGDLSGELGCVPDHLRGRGVGLDGNHITRAYLIAGDVDPPAIDRPVAVADELAPLAAGSRETKAHENVVEAALQQREQVLAGDSGLAGGLHVVAVKLLLEHAVVAARLLLLAQLHTVLALFHAPASMLAGRI